MAKMVVEREMLHVDASTVSDSTLYSKIDLGKATICLMILWYHVVLVRMFDGQEHVHMLW